MIISRSGNTEVDPIASRGIILYDGPFDLDNVHFSNFVTSQQVPMWTIGGQAKYTNVVQGVSFDPNPPTKITMKSRDSTWGDTFVTSLRDKGKKLDYYAPDDNATLYRPDHPLNRDNTCVQPKNTTETIRCDYEMGTLHISGLNKNSYDVVYSSIRRSDNVMYKQDSSYDYSTKFSIILDRGYSYDVEGLRVNNTKQFSVAFDAERKDVISPVVRFRGISNCEIDGLSLLSKEDFLEGAVGYRVVSDGIAVRFQTVDNLPVAPIPSSGVNHGYQRVEFNCS